MGRGTSRGSVLALCLLLGTTACSSVGEPSDPDRDGTEDMPAVPPDLQPSWAVLASQEQVAIADGEGLGRVVLFNRRGESASIPTTGMQAGRLSTVDGDLWFQDRDNDYVWQDGALVTTPRQDTHNVQFYTAASEAGDYVAVFNDGFTEDGTGYQAGVSIGAEGRDPLEESIPYYVAGLDRCDDGAVVAVSQDWSLDTDPQVAPVAILEFGRSGTTVLYTTAAEHPQEIVAGSATCSDGALSFIVNAFDGEVVESRLVTVTLADGSTTRTPLACAGGASAPVHFHDNAMTHQDGDDLHWVSEAGDVTRFDRVTEECDVLFSIPEITTGQPVLTTWVGGELHALIVDYEGSDARLYTDDQSGTPAEQFASEELHQLLTEDDVFAYDMVALQAPDED